MGYLLFRRVVGSGDWFLVAGDAIRGDSVGGEEAKDRCVCGMMDLYWMGGGIDLLCTVYLKSLWADHARDIRRTAVEKPELDNSSGQTFQYHVTELPLRCSTVTCLLHPLLHCHRKSSDRGYHQIIMPSHETLSPPHHNSSSACLAVPHETFL